jgi:DNA-binding FadR family transcriptional regulator
MFILDFVENLLIDTKAILKPGKVFSRKVMRAHKRIYNGLLEKNVKKVHEEMVRHIREVENDLLSAHKKRSIEVQKFNHVGKKRGSIPIFSRGGMIF